MSIKKKCKDFMKDTNGSEAIEMLFSTVMMVCLILVSFLFFTYIFEFNLCHTATKRVVRQIEVSGKVVEYDMQETFLNYMHESKSIKKPTITVTHANYISENKIQLGKSFELNGSCKYRLQLINPGSFDGFYIDLPISTSVSGISEVYWTTSSSYAKKSTH